MRLLALVAALALMQGLLLLLARGLGLRIERRAVVLGLALSAAFVSPWILNDRILLPTEILADHLPDAPAVEERDLHRRLNDAVYEFVPWEADVRRALAAGRLPLWSDSVDGGSSPWANPQAGAASAIAMVARLAPLQDFLTVSLALKMLVGFHGIWLLCRLLGAGRRAALLAAASFALGGGTIAWALHPHTATVVWVPWLVLGVIRTVRRPTPRAVVTTAVACGLLLTAGHPETAVGGALLAVICGLWFSGGRGGFVRGVGAAALAAGLGLCLAAPQLIPFARLVPDSQRAERTASHRQHRQQATWSDHASWCLGEQERLLIHPANPFASGRPWRDPPPSPYNWPIPGSAYAGLLVFAGVVLAVSALRRRLAPFVAFAAVTMLLSVKLVPLARLQGSLPLLQAVEINRFLPVFSVCLCVAGGVGFARVLRTGRGARAWAALLAAAAVSIVIAPAPAVVLVWTLLVIGAALSPRRPQLGALVLLVAVALDLVPWARSMLPAGQADLFYPETPTIAAIREELAGSGPWRVVGRGYLLHANLLGFYGLEDVRYHNPLARAEYERTLSGVFGFHEEGRGTFGSFRNLDHPLLDFLNVRVVISRAALPAPKTMKRFDHNVLQGIRLYRNPDALRRWFLPIGAAVVDRSEVAREVDSLEDARRVVLAREDVGPWRPPGRPWQPRAVKPVSLSPGRAVLRMPPSREKLLATSLQGPEGWIATAAGERLRTLTVNGAFLGVVVPAKIGEVELRFVPPGFRLGVGLFVFGLVVSAALLVRRRHGLR